MNFSINIKRSHLAAIVVSILVFSGVQVAEATLLSKSGSKLCVNKTGAVFARSACKSNETLFSVMPGKARKVRIPETVLGTKNKSKSSSALAQTSMASTLDLLGSAPRTYTSLFTIPEGFDLTKSEGYILGKADGVPNCPSDAPINLLTTVNWQEGLLANGYEWQNDYSQDEIELFDKNLIYRGNGWMAEAFRLYVFKIQDEVKIYFFGGSARQETIVPGSTNLTYEQLEEVSETRNSFSFYLSVLCAPTVTLE